MNKDKLYFFMVDYGPNTGFLDGSPIQGVKGYILDRNLNVIIDGRYYDSVIYCTQDLGRLINNDDYYKCKSYVSTKEFDLVNLGSFSTYDDAIITLKAVRLND